MTCSYCRYLNSDEERRCRRCGRRLYDAYAVAAGGTVAVAQPARRPEPAPVLPEPPRPPRMPRQPTLFPDRPAGNVIPFDGVAVGPKPRTVTRTSTRVQTRRSPAVEEQPRLEFLQPAPPSPRKLSTTVEAVIDCDAPVASPAHRLCAAGVDASMILIAYGLFLTTTYFVVGPFLSSKLVMITMATAAILIAGFYGFVWVCAGTRTPGMCAFRLTLINFDGYPPDASSRWLRYLGICLASCAGGLGLLWALLDEESLAWHDHISKTFPTFRGPETNFVRRR